MIGVDEIEIDEYEFAKIQNQVIYSVFYGFDLRGKLVLLDELIKKSKLTTWFACWRRKLSLLSNTFIQI